MAGISRGHWWRWYEAPEPDKPLPEWLLDIAGGDDPTSAARPWFMIKTNEELKQWVDQRWVKNESIYHSHSGDGRMVQWMAKTSALNFSKDWNAWMAEETVFGESTTNVVRLIMAEPKRMSFLGGVLTLTGNTWRHEGEAVPAGFSGDFCGKHVVIRGPEFGEEPMGYARVGYVVVVGSAYAGCRSRPPGITWWNMPSTPNLCLEHGLIARAIAKLQPTLRCAIVCSSFGTKLEPVSRNGVPKGMRADQEIVVTSLRESQLQTEQPGAGFLA